MSTSPSVERMSEGLGMAGSRGGGARTVSPTGIVESRATRTIEQGMGVVLSGGPDAGGPLLSEHLRGWVFRRTPQKRRGSVAELLTFTLHNYTFGVLCILASRILATSNVLTSWPGDWWGREWEVCPAHQSLLSSWDSAPGACVFEGVAPPSWACPQLIVFKAGMNPVMHRRARCLREGG